MLRVLAVGMTLSAVLGTGLLAAVDDPKGVITDAVASELEKAKETYSKAMESAEKALLAAFDVRSEQIRNDKKLRGELVLEALEEVEGEKSKFAESKKLPDGPAMVAARKVYQESLKSAKAQMDFAYDAAIEGYSRLNKLDKAREIRTQKNQRPAVALVNPPLDRGKTARENASEKAKSRDFGEAAFDAKEETVNQVRVKVGDPQFTVIWDTNADLDLHVLTPDNKELYWEERKGSGGELDVDDVDGFGPENIFWDRSKPHPTGQYRWFVHYYGGLGGQPISTRWKVRIKSNGVVSYKEGTLAAPGRRSETFTFAVP